MPNSRGCLAKIVFSVASIYMGVEKCIKIKFSEKKKRGLQHTALYNKRPLHQGLCPPSHKFGDFFSGLGGMPDGGVFSTV